MPYTIKQCRGALSACNALIVGADSRAMRRHWERTEDLWKQRLKSALHK